MGSTSTFTFAHFFVTSRVEATLDSGLLKQGVNEVKLGFLST